MTKQEALKRIKERIRKTEEAKAYIAYGLYGEMLELLQICERAIEESATREGERCSET